jgi:predicted nucleotidyltransferase
MTEHLAATPRQSIRPDILTEPFLAALRHAGVIEASLFGSVARGEEHTTSDVDLLVRFDHEASWGDRYLLEESLGKLCGRKVQLVTALHPAFAPYILPTLQPIAL